MKRQAIKRDGQVVAYLHEGVMALTAKGAKLWYGPGSIRMDVQDELQKACNSVGHHVTLREPRGSDIGVFIPDSTKVHPLNARYSESPGSRMSYGAAVAWAEAHRKRK